MTGANGLIALRLLLEAAASLQSVKIGSLTNSIPHSQVLQSNQQSKSFTQRDSLKAHHAQS
jgi:hypothetical protein